MARNASHDRASRHFLLHCVIPSVFINRIIFDACKIIETELSQPLKPFRLGEKCAAKPRLHLALTDHLRKSRQSSRTPGNSNIGMSTQCLHVLGDNYAFVGHWQYNFFGVRRSLLI